MSKREKNNNPGGSTPSYNNGPYGEAPPWKGFLTHSPQDFRYTLQALLGALAAGREKEGELVTTPLEF